MKYTVEGFNQKVMLEMGFDCIDAVILRFIVDFWHSNKMTKIFNEGKEFLWIKYSNIINQIPIINIKAN